MLLALLIACMPIDPKKKVKTDDEVRRFGTMVMNCALFLFLFALTFIILGRNSIYKSQFNTFSISGKEYAIVKIYDENVFAWSIRNGKIVRELTYFRMENVNGVELKNIAFKYDKE
ncbi:hypothetical protein AM377_09735 [Serratia marcescens]|nr:hypothetical protein AM377_09735 [Serratia marcescens]